MKRLFFNVNYSNWITHWNGDLRSHPLTKHGQLNNIDGRFFLKEETDSYCWITWRDYYDNDENHWIALPYKKTFIQKYLIEKPKYKYKLWQN